MITEMGLSQEALRAAKGKACVRYLILLFILKTVISPKETMFDSSAFDLQYKMMNFEE